MVCILSENTGKGLEYFTENQLGSRNFVKVTVMSEPLRKGDLINCAKTNALDGIFHDNDILSDGKAYEWVGICSSIRSSEPCCWVLSYEDYYSSEQYDSRNVRCGAGDGFNCKIADFSVASDGTVYDDCKMVLIVKQPQFDAHTGIYETLINVFYHIPREYDGCVLGFHNSSALTMQQIEKGMSDPAASLGFINRAEGDLYIRIL